MLYIFVIRNLSSEKSLLHKIKHLSQFFPPTWTGALVSTNCVKRVRCAVVLQDIVLSFAIFVGLCKCTCFCLKNTILATEQLQWQTRYCKLVFSAFVPCEAIEAYCTVLKPMFVGRRRRPESPPPHPGEDHMATSSADHLVKLAVYDEEKWGVLQNGMTHIVDMYLCRVIHL